ncbi:MAG: heavy metal translocating P-type ATPase [Campylobacter sp.]|uniref:heavy metal translocating P-type ATPase n=1 Tax=Campylobacter sp. TaxID=205 RepID=UPI00297B4DC7|nr:heavy metal translocating P-type ATPase [Campylobacter sp.]MDD7599410.1 heavy metal translocating P-type ATPase [Campylobacteraceae bacterium]MDY5888154.1 heavy metal translocating P-type ATPase [Campylobacter sp.]
MLKRIVISLFLLIFGFVLSYFNFNELYSKTAFLIAFILCGYSVVFAGLKSLANIFKGRFGKIFDENVLMSIACFGAFALGEWAEAAAIMVFYMIGEYFNDLAITRSKDAIKELVALRPRTALLLKGGICKQVLASEVKIGDEIELRAGMRVALDSEVISGKAFVDTSAITGESLPREVKNGDILLAGFVLKDGTLRAKASACESESALARISKLVEQASTNKSPHERFISRFARVYTPVVVILAGLIAFILPFIFDEGFAAGGFEVWANRALIFLVISCPCALVISVPLAFFAGIGAASKSGILIRSSAVLSTLARSKSFIFDKTGTLTKGVFNLNLVCSDKLSDKDFIAHAAHATSSSNHPVAKSLGAAHAKMQPDCKLCGKYECSELSGLGVRAKSSSDELLAGNAKLMKDCSISDFEYNCCHEGSIIHLALNGRYKGHALLGDELKSGAKEMIEGLKNAGINTLMLTGDNEIAAKAVAKELGIDRFYAGLLPEQKIELLERELGGGVVAFVGDGINDAAALARADVGIAINAQDVAASAADVVIINSDIRALSKAFDIAKRSRGIAWENITFALGSKIVIMVLGVLGLAGIWAAVFADVGVSLLCVLNAIRAGRK